MSIPASVEVYRSARGMCVMIFDLSNYTVHILWWRRHGHDHTSRVAVFRNPDWSLRRRVARSTIVPYIYIYMYIYDIRWSCSLTLAAGFESAVCKRLRGESCGTGHSGECACPYYTRYMGGRVRAQGAVERSWATVNPRPRLPVVVSGQTNSRSRQQKPAASEAHRHRRHQRLKPTRPTPHHRYQKIRVRSEGARLMDHIGCIGSIGGQADRETYKHTYRQTNIHTESIYIMVWWKAATGGCKRERRENRADAS